MPRKYSIKPLHDSNQRTSLYNNPQINRSHYLHKPLINRQLKAILFNQDSSRQNRVNSLNSSFTVRAGQAFNKHNESFNEIPVLITNQGKVYHSILPEAKKDLFPMPQKNGERNSKNLSPKRFPDIQKGVRPLQVVKGKYEEGSNGFKYSITPTPDIQPNNSSIRLKAPIKLRPLHKSRVDLVH